MHLISGKGRKKDKAECDCGDGGAGKEVFNTGMGPAVRMALEYALIWALGIHF